MLLPALVGLAVLAGVALHAALTPAPRLPTQKDIDAAVWHTLEKKPLPSFATRAVEAVRPSVVRVRRLGAATDPHGLPGPKEPSNPKEPASPRGPSARAGVAGAPATPDAPAGAGTPRAPGAAASPDKPSLTEIGVGTGVVILDTGVILTNLHVVEGADRLGVVFADGSESEAVVLSVQPENDLAVIRARTIPDDLVAATLRSTQNLAPGDAVAAVGYPFGIGPSASAGVVSGLRRDYISPAGQRILSNLIQFDAAVNPGNSGGPLVTADGEVVGIVTGLLNPTDQQVFIGIGFAVPIENAAAAVGMSPF